MPMNMWHIEIWELVVITGMETADEYKGNSSDNRDGNCRLICDTLKYEN